MVDLSEEQSAVIEGILDWLCTSQQRLTVGGLAGTGKTTVVSALLGHPAVEHLSIKICAFTGKAAQVLRSKGVSAAQTMHSLIYLPSTMCKTCGMSVDEDDPVILQYCQTGFRRQDNFAADLVIVDEASMLSRRLVDDLESYGMKVLYVGDHGQLEPIGDNPGLMLEPDLRLETVHRQAKDSAIIRFAHACRRGESPHRWLGFGRHDIQIAKYSALDYPETYDAVLCGFNRTRCLLNRRIRTAKGFQGDDVLPEETVICLQNSKEHGVFNGQRFTVLDRRTDDGGVVLDLQDECGDKLLSVPITEEGFGRDRVDNIRRRRVLLDWGYAMTTHKSQGSEWGRVAVVEEMHPSWTAARWRYTAATRAAQELHYYV